MAIPLLENASRLWGRIIETSAYDIIDHEGGIRATLGWSRFGDSDELNQDRYELYSQAYKVYRKDPRGRNIIETYATYIIGDGAFVNFESPEDREKWKAFCDENKFEEKLEEIIRLTLIRGNHFVRIFPGDPTLIRHLPATGVGEIITKPNDAEVPVKYIGRGDYYEQEWKADEIVHFRIGKLGNNQWGVPILEPVLPALARLRAFERGQSALLRILVSIPLIRKGPWSTPQIRERKNDFAAMPPPGTIITVSDKESWGAPDHPGWRMNWRDQGRQLNLSVAAGVGLPEYLVTSDASNSNYASSLVAEAPAMRRFKTLQTTFAHQFEELVRRAINPTGEFKFVFKPLIPRDSQKEIRAWMEPYIVNAISHQSFLEKVGIDPAQEMERLRMEGKAPQNVTDVVAKPSFGGFQWRSPVKDIEREIAQKNTE